MSRKPRRRLRRKKRKPNYFLRTLLFFLISVTALYFFLQSATFNVKNIVVSGNVEVSDAEILKLSGLKTGVNIFKVQQQPVLAALAANPLIAETTLLKRYPATLEIHITERKAIALVPSENGMMYIDKEAYSLREKRELTSLDLPVITGNVLPAQFPLGKKISSADLALGLEVVKQLDEDLKKRIAEINVKNNYISLYLNDNSQIRIGMPERLKEKIALFDAILAEEKKKNSDKPIQYIDVSIEGTPVIKYKEN